MNPVVNLGSSSLRSSRRPSSVTWLAVGVLILSAIYFTRLILALGLPSLPLLVPSWYLPLTGAVWGIVCLLAGVGLLTRQAWASPLSRWASLLFVAWTIVDRLAFARSDYATGTRALSIGAALVGAGLIWWIIKRPQAKKYFGEDSL